MEQFNILFDGIAEPVQAHIVGPPIFVGEAIEKALVVRSPDQGRQCAWNDIGQYRARLKIAHPRLEALGTVVVHGEGEIPPVRADRNRAQAEIFLPLCKGGFIENDLGVPAGDGSPEPFTVLRSEEHTSELQSLMRISYAVFCLNKKKTQ